MNDHEDGNGRHEDEAVNFEGVLPHNRPHDDDDNEEEEEGNDNGDDDTADSTDNEEEVEDDDDDEESVVPTADEVELEYTFPDDFPDRSFDAWRTVVRRFFRLIIDPSCTEIPDDIFNTCALLIEIVFPDNSSLTRIGFYAFNKCKNLQRINAFPDGMIEFGESAFEGCRSLGGEVAISSSIRFVRHLCFSGCKAITSAVFENDPTTTTTTAAANPNSVVELGECIFFCCDELRSVRLPYNVIEIPRCCFHGCLKLTDVPIPVPVRVIEELAFYGCSSLTSMYFSENIDAIGKWSFNSCTSLKCITIRSSNIQFGSAGFTSCPALSSIKIHPTAWPKLFEAMNNNRNFIYKFFREYQYQIDRLIEWKKNQQVANIMMPSTSSSSSSSSSVLALSTQNNNPIRKDEGKRDTKRPRL